MNATIKNVVLCVAVFTVFYSTPLISYAAYTFNGRTFDTFEEMQRYVAAYMEVWQKVYGKDTKTRTEQTASKRKYDIEIETSHVRDISYDSARFVGTMNRDKSDLVRIWFDYGQSPILLTKQTSTQVLGELHGSDYFDRKEQGLLPNTTYYYRAGGINKNGHIDYGSIKSFKTLVNEKDTDALVSARTGWPKDIDENRVTLRGNIRFHKEKVAYVWFEYGDDEKVFYGRTPVMVLQKGGNTQIEYTLRGLEDSETYYYRFVAKDTAGAMSYGKTYEFTTSKDIAGEEPVITTVSAEVMSAHSVRLKGEVDMNDFDDGIVFFVYGEDRDEITEVTKKYNRYSRITERGDLRQKVLVDANTGSFRTYLHTLQDIDDDTKHYFAIGVQYENDEGKDTLLMGKIRSFKTKRV